MNFTNKNAIIELGKKNIKLLLDSADSRYTCVYKCLSTGG